MHLYFVYVSLTIRKLTVENVTCLNGHGGIYLWNIEYKRQLLRAGYEDPLQRQPQEHRPGLLLFLVWMNCQLHELELVD